MQAGVQKNELRVGGADFAALARETLARGASFRFRATGFSMSPFIRSGDLVTISPAGRIRAGDIAAFTHPESGLLVVHRVVGGNGDCFMCKGDNTPDADGAVPASCVLGRISRIERNGRVVRLGIGPERRLIALLSRTGLLPRLLQSLRRAYRR